jgi:hypothetical protein
MFATRGKHQQGFGFQLHGPGKHHLPQLLAQLSASGFARGEHRHPAAGKLVREPLDMRALARAIEPFERDETAPPFMLH